MSKRVWLFFLALCCFAIAAAVLVQSGARLSSEASRLRAAQRDGALSQEVSGSEPRPAHPNDGMESGAVSHELRPAAGAGAAPERAVKEAPGSEQNATRPPGPVSGPRPPGAVSGQEAAHQAEVWSYAPALQQIASNNFVRALEKLAGAKSEFDRYLALGDAAKGEFIFGRSEQARNYATEWLSLDEKFKGEPWRDGSATHDANLVLGRVAAQEDRLDEAKQYLLEAGKSTGSPMLGSFGPNMSLARDLLQRGEQETVLQYFDLCRKFWQVGNEKLTQWSEEVKAGRMPDFGANLLY